MKSSSPLARFVRSVIATVAVVFFPGSSRAADDDKPLSPEQVQFFESKIRPVLVDQCFRCHSVDGQGQRGGLSVDNREAMLAGGESGPAIVPGNLDESMLWNAINHQDFRMPPKSKLPQSVIEDFRAWILMGAPDPRVSTGVIIHSKVTAEDIQQAKSFRSFAAPVSTSPSEAKASGWAETTIDKFVAGKWDEHGLEPASDCEPNALVRRLYFDLIGLPPSFEQRDAFIAAYKSDSQVAVSSLVDELMQKPQFGERWARHWLDVARYAESSGKENESTFPHAWRYRNYVIDSFNRDKPYDQFIREQIAGDLLPAKNDAEWSEHLIATGFLALGPKSLSEQNPRQFQADMIDEQIDTTTRVILGLSVACARCHDHKFDPIPQTDYYALAGIFQSTQTLFGGSRSLRNRQPSNLIIMPVHDPNPLDQPIPLSELEELKKELKVKQEELAEARRAQRSGNTTSAKGTNPQLSAAILDQLVSQISAKIVSVDAKGKPMSFCMGVQDDERIRSARLLVRGEIDQPAQEVERGLVQVLTDKQPRFSNKSSGRLELAKWLASRENPLTARVMANRVWQHLIGKALVTEPDNFGRSGPAPTHPELLDHLAIELMDHGWSVKQLIRTIATSRVYRLSSKHDAARFESDPENAWIARANVKRLDAEALRDTMLSISGLIELKPPKSSLISSFGTTVIGPNGPVSVPTQVLSSIGSNTQGNALRTMLRAGARNPNSNPLEAPDYHRSIYLPIARNSLPRALDVFDFAEPSLVVGTREVSNTADQALFMLNNPMVMEQCDSIARRLIKSTNDPKKRVLNAFILIYGRDATGQELAAIEKFIRKGQAAESGTRPEERNFKLLSQLCQALLGASEFRLID